MWWFSKRDKPKNTAYICGVTLGWSLKPQLAWSDKTILRSPHADFLFYPEYFPNGEGTWPIDPRTGDRLPIAGSEDIQINSAEAQA